MLTAMGRQVNRIRARPMRPQSELVISPEILSVRNAICRSRMNKLNTRLIQSRPISALSVPIGSQVNSSESGIGRNPANAGLSPGNLLFYRAYSSAQYNMNPYAVLGVDSNASSSDIKKAYYKLAKKYHPDVSGDRASREQFIKISAAYEILSDPNRRAHFDATGFDANEMPTGQHAEDLFTQVWQEFGVAEYFEEVRQDGATAMHAARHGDYSLMWDFAKNRKLLIASVILPVAAMVRFPGLFGAVMRIGIAVTIAVLERLPPQVAYGIFRRIVFGKGMKPKR